MVTAWLSASYADTEQILREWTAEEKAAEAAIAENNDPTYPLTPIDRTNTRIIAQDEVNAACTNENV